MRVKRTREPKPWAADKFRKNVFFLSTSPDGHRYFGENFNRDYYGNRVVPAIETWASLFPHVFIVMEDSPAARVLVNRRTCASRTFPSGDLLDSAPVTEHTCDGRPIILSNCSNGYWGETGPCCKCTAAFRHLTRVRRDVLDEVEWMVYR